MSKHLPQLARTPGDAAPPAASLHRDDVEDVCGQHAGERVAIGGAGATLVRRARGATQP